MEETIGGETNTGLLHRTGIPGGFATNADFDGSTAGEREELPSSYLQEVEVVSLFCRSSEIDVMRWRWHADDARRAREKKAPNDP